MIATTQSSVFFGGSVVAAVLAGTIALFAPCCVSVMLPAYFASAFQNRRLLVAMTFLFGAGVATVIVPIALGVSAVRRVLLGGHPVVYIAGGSMLLGLSIFTLGGGRLRLPSPSGPPTRRGPLGVYALGLFSGVASSCCAPVLAGVVALSGIAGSFLAALGLGLAYVFGMVAPMLVVSVLWDRHDWRSSRLFRPRPFTYRIGPWRRTIAGTALASGVLLGVMGVWAVWAGLAGGMRSSYGGWQGRFLLWLQARGTATVDSLSWLPGWAAALILLAVVAGLGRLAFRQLGWLESSTNTTPAAIHEERDLEHQE